MNISNMERKMDDGGELARGLREAATVGGIGIIGRLVWAARQHQAGKRLFFSWATFIDVLIAIPSAFVGLGLFEAATAIGLLPPGLPPSFRTAVIGIAGYLGPYAVDAAFDTLLRWFGKK
jgi:hypothetical protein